ncbi:MAG: 2-phosphosulfolactate phosphatase [Bacteroidales bacterium]|nr:2-phosphosulfolactate phosphatase [Bacteroidales bacterium]
MNVSKIELSLTPTLYSHRTLRTHHTTLAVDVLRATTSICAAFKAGVEEIVPLDSLEPLVHYSSLGYLTAAERGGKKVEGAQWGNSPTEYLSADLHHQRLAYSTTNGTVSILRGSDAERTLVGAFANISALTQLLLQQPQNLVILCSGWKDNFSIEDTLFAGALCHRLVDSGAYNSDDDAAHMAMALWDACGSDPYHYSMLHASHVRRLIGFGAGHDVAFAFREDTCPLVPQLKEGRLTL